MDGLAFPSGQCRGRSWPNAYGLCPWSLIARSINQSINRSLNAFIDQSVPHNSTNTVSAVAFLTMLFLWNLFHRRFVLTEVVLSCPVLYCNEADFVIHNLPLPCLCLLPLPGSIWLTSCKC